MRVILKAPDGTEMRIDVLDDRDENGVSDSAEAALTAWLLHAIRRLPVYPYASYSPLTYILEISR